MIHTINWFDHLIDWLSDADKKPQKWILILLVWGALVAIISLFTTQA